MSGVPRAEVSSFRALRRPRSLWLMGLTAGAVAGLDQVSKALIVASIAPGAQLPVIPGWFDLTLTYNRGAAFGLMADLPPGLRTVLLTVTTLAALGAIFWFLVKDYFNDRLGQFALALILGGAFGNVFDRIRLGAVVDFLDFYIGTRHWPAFNLADSAICVGVFLLLLWQPRRQE